MGSGRARRFAALSAAVLLIGASAALVAYAASSQSPRSTATAATRTASTRSVASRPLKYACTGNLYNAKDVLHFVARPSRCEGSSKKLVRFATTYPVYVCRKE